MGWGPASVEASTLPPPGLRRWECSEFFKKLKEKKNNRSRRSWGKKYIRKNIIRTKRWLQERERAGGKEGGAGGRAARALVAAEARRPVSALSPPRPPCRPPPAPIDPVSWQ